ncbi:vegetative cell wall protein gp1-like [Trichechus manatus latirostris]|uniref:Vegetative cell wall protein gp1-like n=1 Tax=Trichechus manatus latirostris TaxID=127582 RepID=A0A2Y9FZE9_TRIMA|nr:vegetative cell wall protein gp1-like [Trichechus manatus latirostris]
MPWPGLRDPEEPEECMASSGASGRSGGGAWPAPAAARPTLCLPQHSEPSARLLLQSPGVSPPATALPRVSGHAKVGSVLRLRLGVPEAPHAAAPPCASTLCPAPPPLPFSEPPPPPLWRQPSNLTPELQLTPAPLPPGMNTEVPPSSLKSPLPPGMDTKQWRSTILVTWGGLKALSSKAEHSLSTTCAPLTPENLFLAMVSLMIINPQ